MYLDLLVFISCIPIILMCAYIYSKDMDKEPVSIIRRLFIFGIFSILPIMVIEYLTNKLGIIDKSNPVSLFINVFVTISLIEEGTKWVIVNKSVYSDKEFNHPYDAIIYCVFASLGFALIENILYVVQDGITVGLLRAVTTIPLHTFSGIIMGYFLGNAKREDISNNKTYARRYMLLSLLVPILSHTIYDYFIFMETKVTTFLFVMYVIVMYIISYIIVRNISVIKNNFDGSKYNSKKKLKYVGDSEIFTNALTKVLSITLGLIFVSAISIILHLF